LVADINPETYDQEAMSPLMPADSFPNGFTLHKGHVYFWADDGKTGFEVHRLDMAPAVTITAPTSGAIAPVGAPIPLQGQYVDEAGDGPYTAQWVFSSMATGEFQQEARLDGNEVSAQTQFQIPGVYSICLAVTDRNGLKGTANTVGDLPAYIVIYDPTGGFVTGGGWINSPAGAYALDPSLTGKATFGFVAKYLKGANVPTGHTEFQFKAGDLNFKSVSYQWLVVAGARAQFKGAGTINGEGNYGFMLTAIDGALLGGSQPDRFRIKLWDAATGVIVYDNQAGTDDNAELDDATLIQGGSIMIHKL
jgi:hypothetical protein